MRWEVLFLFFHLLLDFSVVEALRGFFEFGGSLELKFFFGGLDFLEMFWLDLLFEDVFLGIKMLNFCSPSIVKLIKFGWVIFLEFLLMMFMILSDFREFFFR